MNNGDCAGSLLSKSRGDQKNELVLSQGRNRALIPHCAHAVALPRTDVYFSFSMRRRVVHRLMPVLLPLLLTFGLSDQLALCTGPGGHRAIEFLRAACCDHFAPPGAVDGGTDCPSSCTDTPLGTSALRSDDSFHGSQTSTVTAVPAQPALRMDGRVSSARIHPVRWPGDPPRLARTTVNLC